MQERKEEQSIGELFASLARETTTLVRQEVQLAKTEMSQKMTTLTRDVGMIGAGAAVAYAGLLAVVAAVILLLADLINNAWLAALIVGLIILAVGYFLVQRGIDAMKRADLTPRETIQTLKEDTEWAKDQMK